LNNNDNWKYWLKDWAQTYTKEWKNGCYYFSAGNSLYFYPDMEHNENIPVKQKYLWDNNREKIYPHYSKQLSKYLAQNCLWGILSKNNIPLEWKSIGYHDWEYYLKSFGNETRIWLKTLSEWWIIDWNTKEAIWQNLQLLNLQNFIKNKFWDKIKDGDRFDYTSSDWIFIENSAWIKAHIVLDNNNNIRSSYPFFAWDNWLDKMSRYVDYLNKLKRSS
jgi:hypothetical protein